MCDVVCSLHSTQKASVTLLTHLADGANSNPWALLPREVVLGDSDDTGHAGMCVQQ
jgi:hypothetical protein